MRANHTLGDWTMQTDAVLVVVLSPTESHQVTPRSVQHPLPHGRTGFSAPFYVAPHCPPSPCLASFCPTDTDESLGCDCSFKRLLPVPQGLLCPSPHSGVGTSRSESASVTASS